MDFFLSSSSLLRLAAGTDRYAHRFGLAAPQLRSGLPALRETRRYRLTWGARARRKPRKSPR